MKKLIALFILCSSILAYGQATVTMQNTYPTNYFGSPLDIPLILSGTFGELRPNHFHAGLDIKTQQREGLNVLASADGYISRIRIAHWGYGKALYITHSNGYTTVYGHLQKFSDKIETYIKKQQYKNESFEVQAYPSASELPIKKGEIIALSGSTGGFMGPHLHFEIRDSSSEKTINPFLFGIQINDSKRPTINTLVGYSLSDDAQINQANIPLQLSFKRLSNGDLLADKINAFGKIGFGVNAFDQLDNASNQNGLYSLELSVNGEKFHEFKASVLAFSEDKYINLLVDYERLDKMGQRIQKCFIEPSNKLNMYAASVNNGYLTIEDKKSYNVDIIAKDFSGNTQKITIPVVGKNDPVLVRKTETQTPYKISFAQFNQFSKNGVTVAFPKNTFYADLWLDFDVVDSVANVHYPNVPIHYNYTITFDVSKYSESEKKQMYIASINKKGTKSYESTVKKDSIFYASTKKLGKFTLLSDKDAPNIQLHNFKNDQWITNHETLKVKIFDYKSGINTYRAEINGQWILMEYDVTTGVLTYDFKDLVFTDSKHELKVTVTDNVGNTNTLNATFFRKI
ncbi:MAG: M23 family metallopeptidase [Lutibacter sp.]|nr:M23 family metallopeptidase [Lutibacter sp.]